MKNFLILNTDLYQLKMIFANVVLGYGNNRTGFEGFFRHIKKEVNPFTNFYIFDGEKEVIDFMEKVKLEIIDPKLPNTIVEIIEHTITADNKNELIEIFKENWKKLTFDFDYNVVPNGTKIFPLVPVFQFNGPNVFGQPIETMVTNIYNGKTALKTINYLIDKGYNYKITTEDFNYISGIIAENEIALNRYFNEIRERALAYRNCTNKILLEAGFRRAPNFKCAYNIAKIALECGFNGTSNTSLLFNNDARKDQIGGTMAHAFVMGMENERMAFKMWDKFFKGTNFLVDTYDVDNAIDTIIDLINNKEISVPMDVRIDSDPLDVYARNITKKLNDNGFNAENYLSGDMTVFKITKYENEGVPFKKVMIGTKLVYGDNESIVQMLNCGFVYKVVEVDIIKDNKITTIYPEKKATGKSNYTGLKDVIYNDITNTLNVYTRTKNFGFTNLNNIDFNPTINFI